MVEVGQDAGHHGAVGVVAGDHRIAEIAAEDAVVRGVIHPVIPDPHAGREQGVVHVADHHRAVHALADENHPAVQTAADQGVDIALRGKLPIEAAHEVGHAGVAADQHGRLGGDVAEDHDAADITLAHETGVGTDIAADHEDAAAGADLGVAEEIAVEEHRRNVSGDVDRGGTEHVAARHAEGVGGLGGNATGQVSVEHEETAERAACVHHARAGEIAVVQEEPADVARRGERAVEIAVPLREAGDRAEAPDRALEVTADVDVPERVAGRDEATVVPAAVDVHAVERRGNDAAERGLPGADELAEHAIVAEHAEQRVGGVVGERPQPVGVEGAAFHPPRHAVQRRRVLIGPGIEGRRQLQGDHRVEAVFEADQFAGGGIEFNIGDPQRPPAVVHEWAEIADQRTVGIIVLQQSPVIGDDHGVFARAVHAVVQRGHGQGEHVAAQRRAVSGVGQRLQAGEPPEGRRGRVVVHDAQHRHVDEVAAQQRPADRRVLVVAEAQVAVDRVSVDPGVRDARRGQPFGQVGIGGIDHEQFGAHPVVGHRHERAHALAHPDDVGVHAVRDAVAIEIDLNGPGGHDVTRAVDVGRGRDLHEHVLPADTPDREEL